MKRYQVMTHMVRGTFSATTQQAKHPWQAVKQHMKTLPKKCKRTVYRIVVLERI